MTPNRSTLAGAAAFCALSISGCNQKKNEYVAPPPPEVNVQKPLVQDTTIHIEFPGRTRAYERVEIRARLTGFLKTREFQAGEFVKAGTPLFTIEPDEFDAAVATANGNLAQAEAALELATTNFEKMDAAFKRNAVSEIDKLEAAAQKDAADAQVKIAKAALTDADRNRTYADIVSPIDGRVSQALVDQGNLVSAAEGTLLTTVVRDDPAYVDFEISERAILPYLESRPNAGEITLDEKTRALPLTLTLADGSKYGKTGSFDFIDNSVNPDSGTIRARALFKNEDGKLAAGLFARVGIPNKLEGAIIVPRIAIQRDLGGTFALVVGDDNKIQRRPVTPSPHSIGDLRIVEEGIGPDDRVVVSNLQRVRDGIEVTPNEIDPPTLDPVVEDGPATPPVETPPTPKEPETPETPPAPGAPEVGNE